MKTRHISYLLVAFLTACTVQKPPSEDPGPLDGSHHQADQLDVTQTDTPTINPITGEPLSEQDTARIAVAYCAAAILDGDLPNSCEVVEADATTSHLRTVCDTGFEISWNCETCGDAIADGTQLGHIGLHSNTEFQVGSVVANAPLWLCKMDDDGSGGFTTEIAR